MGVEPKNTFTLPSKIGFTLYDISTLQKKSDILLSIYAIFCVLSEYENLLSGTKAASLVHNL
jgi:hypothetical protein